MLLLLLFGAGVQASTDGVRAYASTTFSAVTDAVSTQTNVTGAASTQTSVTVASNSEG